MQYATRTALARDWRVVNIPNEDGGSTDVATFFLRMLQHVYDSLEPFVPTQADKEAPIRAAIGSSQKSDFQDVPLTVYVADVATMFGVYMKFYILREDVDVDVACPSNRRNAFEVSFES